jgi:hypothetical protein
VGVTRGLVVVAAPLGSGDAAARGDAAGLAVAVVSPARDPLVSDAATVVVDGSDEFDPDHGDHARAVAATASAAIPVPVAIASRRRGSGTGPSVGRTRPGRPDEQVKPSISSPRTESLR